MKLWKLTVCTPMTLRRWTFTVVMMITVTGFSQVSFNVNANACQLERLNIENVTDGFSAYEWDFCEGDLSQTPSAGLVGSFTGSVKTSFEVAQYNGNWYGFYTSFSSGTITRLDFGDDLANTPTATVLSISGGLINRPYDIDLIFDGGQWYGFVANFGNSNLIRLSFGTALDSDSPSAEVVSITGTTLNGPAAADFALDNGTYYALIGNNSGTNASILSFASGITGDATGADISIGNTGTEGVKFAKDDSDWYAYVNSNRLSIIDFGSNISLTPTANEDVTLDVAITNGVHMEFFYDAGDFFLIMGDRSGNITRVNLGSDLTANSGAVTKFDTGVFTSGIISFGGLKVGSTYSFFAFGVTSNDLYRVSFPLTCGASSESSSDQEPYGVTYSTDGTFTLSVQATDANGFHNYASQSVSVSIDTSPDITFTIDEPRCTSVSNSFTSNNVSGGITSYSWDFDGDDIEDSDLQNPTFNFATPGNYEVSLIVSDGVCENYFTQSLDVFDPPVPDFSIESPLCSNSSITFQNSTNESGAGAIITYLWEFIDQPPGTVVGSATSEDAAFTFSTEGDKTIRLTASIPGCDIVTEQNVNLTSGPNADFFAASVCQGEAMQFTNTSVDAVSYSWDFGDGFMSTAENPSHIFTDAGNFFVTLTAFNALGCEDTEVVEVAVSDSPQINFDFDIPCTSTGGIQFFDLTTVDNADLVSWRWYVDDVEVSTDQNPQIVFESIGTKNIRLVVQSSNSCESSYSEDIEVLDSPTPDFTINLGCQGEASSFNDNTTSTGNPVVSWLWTVDGVNYGTQDINHVFTDAGIYDVTLEVTGQNFCSETITKSVEIIELPTINFSVLGECDNQLIRATDQSTASADPIISRRWMLDGESVGNGSQLILESLENDTYDLSLEVETEAGCIISATQQLEINVAPVSSFTSSRTYGVPEDQLTFTNTSTGGTSFQWLLDGIVTSSNQELVHIPFPNSGTYNISLVAQNSLGCYDTTTQQILIAIPEVDLAIGSFELVNENNVGRIFLEIQNLSNLPVEFIEAQIVLENTFAISEQIVQFIGVGESSLVSLNAGIPLNVSEPSYFCVKLSSQYENYVDVNPTNHEKCITIEPVIKVEDPFPNPVTDQFRLKLIVNESGTASISLINSAGKVQINAVENVSEGLNNFFIDMSILDPGIYYVLVDVLGTIHKRKVIKL